MNSNSCLLVLTLALAILSSLTRRKSWGCARRVCDAGSSARARKAWPFAESVEPSEWPSRLLDRQCCHDRKVIRDIVLRLRVDLALDLHAQQRYERVL